LRSNPAQPCENEVCVPYLMVFLGAGIGGVLRQGVNAFTLRHLSFVAFPFGTLFINIAGSLAMGLIAGYFAHRGPDFAPAARLFLTTGILGGFTTFSAFSLEAVLLYERGAVAPAAAYVVGSVVAALIGCALGLWLVRAIVGPAA
jgi:CrcB protein